MRDPWTVLQEQVTRLADKVNALPSIREATVTDDNPLQVVFDTDTTPTTVFATTTPGLEPGDRVLTVRLRRYMWVIGKRIGTNVPSAPAAPTCTVVGGSVTIAWVAPYDGGSPIISYAIDLARTDIPAGDTVPAASSPVTLTPPSGGYVVAIRARNALGWGPPSAYSSPFTIP